MEQRPDIAPHPASKEDPDRLHVLWAAEPGPLPDDVAQDMRELADALDPSVKGSKGIIGTRFGRRVIVAPLHAPEDTVDIAIVDASRNLALTMGGKDPTPAGALLAQILEVRSDVVYGFVKAPDIDGLTLSLLQQTLPALRGATSAYLPAVGHIALGRRPQEVQGALETALAQEEEHDPDDVTFDDRFQA